MKRDMDFVRELLLAIEANNGINGTSGWIFDTPEDLGISGRTPDELSYHLQQLIDAGLVDGESAGRMPIISKLTWRGHEFLDTLREPETWDRTKSVARRAGGFGFDILMAIGRDLIEAKVKQLVGLSAGI